MRLINVPGGKRIMMVHSDNRPVKKNAYVYFILLMVLAGSNGCNNTDTNQQSVILKPVSGDTYIAGDTLVVSWLESIAYPSLSYRYRHSEVWDSLSVIDYSDKSVKVILPDAWYSDSFQIQVEDRSGKINTAISGYFSVVFIKLFPLDRGTFFVGDTVALKWRHNPSKFSGIRIRLSTNGGKTFNELLSKSLNAELTEYQWVAGQEISGYPFAYPSDKCVIHVQDYDNAGYSDISKTFSIKNSK
jgi:hypothetical protein